MREPVRVTKSPSSAVGKLECQNEVREVMMMRAPVLVASSANVSNTSVA